MGEGVQRRLRQVRVLGPVDVVTIAGPTPLGGPLERTLFAALVLSANRSVPTDQLAEILWGAAPPPSRDNTLQTYVSRLRHLVGTDRIRSHEHSYLLAVEPDEVDAVAFEQLVVDAATARLDRPGCLARCDKALAMWRGVAFGELAERDPFRLESIRLDEIRIFGVEMKLECQIALGREEIVVGALEALAEEYPYRERIWHLLMVALALSGRRTEALRACHVLRNHLAEVGLEPTAEIKRLEEAIHSDDHNLRAELPTGSDSRSERSPDHG